MENNIHGKTSSKKRVIRIAASAVVIAALAVAAYFRTNPKWRAAEFTIDDVLY